MSYEKAVEWCENHVPQMQYDTFNEWMDACESELSTPELFDNSRFVNLMRESWEAGSSDRQEAQALRERIEQEQEEFIEPSKPVDETIEVTKTITPKEQVNPIGIRYVDVKVDLQTNEPVSVKMPDETEIPIKEIPVVKEQVPVVEPTIKQDTRPIKTNIGSRFISGLKRGLGRLFGR